KWQKTGRIATKGESSWQWSSERDGWVSRKADAIVLRRWPVSSCELPFPGETTNPTNLTNQQGRAFHFVFIRLIRTIRGSFLLSPSAGSIDCGPFDHDIRASILHVRNLLSRPRRRHRRRNVDQHGRNGPHLPRLCDRRSRGTFDL